MTQNTSQLMVAFWLMSSCKVGVDKVAIDVQQEDNLCVVPESSNFSNAASNTLLVAETKI